METIPQASHLSLDCCSEDDHIDAKQLKAFLQSKAGVKGLVDSGITKIPNIFIHPLDNTLSNPSVDVQLQIPTIDLTGFQSDRRMEIVDAIRDAAQTRGFFRMVNHGVPISIMENMLNGVRQFHEQPQEVKKTWYFRNDPGQRIFDNYTNIKAASWRDTLAFEFPDGEIDQEVIPQLCRNATSEYMKCILQLKEILSELLSEALGLRSDYLSSIECMKGALIACHYYPACPQPELTFGSNAHTDASFLSLLLENNIDRLQVLHQNQWVDVPHRHGCLIANVGDILQVVSNDKFKSVRHRVLAGRTGPRISATCFLAPTPAKNKPYGPAKELLSKENPPIYEGISILQYLPYYNSIGKDGSLALQHYRISS